MGMLMLTMLWASSVGWAQVASDGAPIPGTVQAGIFTQAPADNRRVFGVSSYLDGTILPMMGARHGPFLVVDTASILGVTRAASTGCWAIAPDSWPGSECTLPMDLGASQVGVGYSGEYGGVFYAATYTTAYIPTSTTDRMIWSEAIIPGMAIVAPYTAPLVVGPTGVLKSVDDGFLGDGMEYTVGGRLALPIGDDTIAAHAGFMASATHQGFFVSATEQQARAQLTAALQQQALAYLLAGLSRSPLLFSAVDELGEWPMLTSLLARKVALPRPLDSAANTTTDTDDEAAIPFWTGHIEQYNIGPIDVRAAVSWKPVVSLHALMLTWHTANFNPVIDEDFDYYDDFEVEDWSMGLSVGMVSVPAAYYLAAPGGPSPYLEAAFRSPRGGGITVTMNHPDTLVAFPYAHSALHISGKLRL